MRAYHLASVIVLAAGLAGPGEAAVIGRNRFKLVDARLDRKVAARLAEQNGVRLGWRAATLRRVLGPRVRRNLDATGVLESKTDDDHGWASATLVQRGPAGRALVLTCAHVVEAQRALGSSSVTFGTGRGAARARLGRVVASSAALDYALVEVEFEPGARPPAAARLADRGLGDEAYYTTGFDALDAVMGDPDLAGFDRSPRDRRFFRSLAPGRPVQSLQTGRRLFADSAVDMRPGSIVLNGELNPEPRRVVLTSTSSLPGGSGRGLFSHADHRLVAIQSAAPTRSIRTAAMDLRGPRQAIESGAVSLAVSTADIVADLRGQLGGLRGADLRAVRALLADAAAP